MFCPTEMFADDDRRRSFNGRAVSPIESFPRLQVHALVGNGPCSKGVEGSKSVLYHTMAKPKSVKLYRCSREDIIDYVDSEGEKSPRALNAALSCG